MHSYSRSTYSPLYRGSLVALNPQPLPPGPSDRALRSGIIIVGG